MNRSQTLWDTRRTEKQVPAQMASQFKGGDRQPTNKFKYNYKLSQALRNTGSCKNVKQEKLDLF